MYRMMDMKIFEHSHIPDYLKEIVAPIDEIAHQMRKTLDDTEYRERGLHKLLEARNSFVQAKWNDIYEGK